MRLGVKRESALIGDGDEFDVFWFDPDRLHIWGIAP